MTLIDPICLPRAKHIAKYIMMNFMVHPTNYNQVFIQNDYEYTLEQHVGTRGRQFWINIRHRLNSLNVMAYRYYKDEDGVLCAGHGDSKEILDTIEALLIRLTCIVGPVLDMVEVRTKDATEERKVANICSNGWIGDIEYNNQHGFALHAIYTPEKDTSNHHYRINVMSADKFKGPFPPAIFRGELKQLSGLIYDWVKEEMEAENP